MRCDTFVIDKWHYYFYYTCIVWKSGECESQAWTMYVCMCGMWFTDDIVIDDTNLYEVTLMFMIMLIENDDVENDIVVVWELCCLKT